MVIKSDYKQVRSVINKFKIKMSLLNKIDFLNQTKKIFNANNINQFIISQIILLHSRVKIIENKIILPKNII